MTEFRVEVVRIGSVRKHDNADTLSITDVHGGYPCVFRTGEFIEGDLATYVPVDAIMPDLPEWSFLGSRRRIEAKRLRGIFSMGLLTKAPDGFEEGADVRDVLGVEKWDPSEDVAPAGGPRVKTLCEDDEPHGPATLIPVYDIEGYRRHKGVLVDGEEVVLTEKIHGENARLFHDGSRLWVGSRTRWKRLDSECAWSAYARRESLTERLAAWPGLVFYGELYGNTDMKYDAAGGRRLRIFDVFDTSRMAYLDHDVAATKAPDLERVPLLHRGPWSRDLLSLCEGTSTLGGHIVEGFVVKPVRERVSHMGRVILKMVGEGYLTRKKKS
jgi:RNA ligase (TIGR02306 family)